MEPTHDLRKSISAKLIVNNLLAVLNILTFVLVYLNDATVLLSLVIAHGHMKLIATVYFFLVQ